MKLISSEIIEGGQFTKGTSVYVFWEKGKSVVVSGDNKVGKSTVVDMVLLGLASVGGEDIIKRLTNKNSGKLEGNLEFIGKDRLKYKVHYTKSQFILEYEGENVPSPKEKIRELLGNVGTMPYDKKNAGIDEIVKWLASFSNDGGAEFAAKIDANKRAAKEIKNSRADATRSYKALKETIGDFITEQAWEHNEKKYGKDVDIKELSGKLDIAGKRSDNYIKAETKLKEFTTRREQLMAELTELEGKIQQAEDYLEKNKSAKTEYDVIKQQYESAAELSAKYQWWKNIKKQKEEMDDFETASQRADSIYKDLMKERNELLSNLIPNVKGLELLLEDEDGKNGRQASLYYNGFSAKQLSRTEFTELVMKIWIAKGIGIIVIDEVDGLGSDFIKMLNRFKKKGAYILYTEMRRGQEKISIEVQE